VSDKKRVFVGLSGGVDSSAAAALLLESGYDCAGMFMITSEHSRHTQGRAEAVAAKLGIELHILDLRPDFNHILEYFIDEYSRGRTPNPCVVCNRLIKFGKLWDFARDRGADFIATGHYARVLKNGGNAGLYAAADRSKDQSYVLAMVGKDVLEHILFPVGSYSKQQARELAAESGLGTAGHAESQEICFIPDNDYVAMLEHRRPELVRRGKIVDTGGKVLGEHRGVHRFTIGQRRGPAVAMGKPYYVTEIDAATNTIVLGPKQEVMHPRLCASGENWLVEKPQQSFRAVVKIRYNDNGAAAVVVPGTEGVIVDFDEPKSAITPGQLVVFCTPDENGDRVVGGAWIDKAGDS